MMKNAYSVKSVSTDAVISSILGVIAIACMAGAIIASYLYDGKGPAVVGLLGVGSLLFAFSGLGFSRAAWRSQDGGFLLKRIAMIINIIPIGAALLLYVIGWIVL